MADQTIPSIKNLRGKIGIGTTAPATLLHLNSAVNNGSVLRIESTASDSYPHLSLKNDVREYQVTAHGGLSDAFTIYDGTAGAHRFTISTDGNVGISTTTPYAYDTTATRLHVSNSRSSGSLSELARFECSSDADGSGAVVRLGTSNDRGMYLEGGRTGSVPYASIGTTEYDGAKTEGIRIASGGNVGIGTTTPQHELDVDGTIRHTSTIVSNAHYTAFTIGSDRATDYYG